MSGTLPSEDSIDALMFTQSIMERCQIPFIVLGPAAQQIHDLQPLEVHKITLGVLQNHAMPEVTSLLPTVYPPIEVQQDGWRIVHKNVPVIIKVITKRYPTLLNPDIRFYYWETFKIPNPWDEYWGGDHYDV